MDQHGSLCDVATQRKFPRFYNEVLRGERYGDVDQNGEVIHDEIQNDNHRNEQSHAKARDDLFHEQSNAQSHDAVHRVVTLVLSSESTHRDGRLAQSPDGNLDDKHLHDEESHEARQRYAQLHRDELE